MYSFSTPFGTCTSLFNVNVGVCVCIYLCLDLDSSVNRKILAFNLP